MRLRRLDTDRSGRVELGDGDGGEGRGVSRCSKSMMLTSFRAIGSEEAARQDIKTWSQSHFTSCLVSPLLYHQQQ